jgi:Spy/CpxP family protein refolding chaperone
MKFIRKNLIIAGVAIMLVAAVAVSQTVTKARHMHGMGFGFDEHMLGFMTDYLDLTDAQQAQVKDIFAKEKPIIQPLMDQLKQGHHDLMQLETSGTFDEAKVRALAAQHTQTMTDLIVEKARVHSQIFQLLTPEQKAKATKLMQRHEQHMMNHNAPPNGGGV